MGWFKDFFGKEGNKSDNVPAQLPEEKVSVEALDEAIAQVSGLMQEITKSVGSILESNEAENQPEMSQMAKLMLLIQKINLLLQALRKVGIEGLKVIAKNILSLNYEQIQAMMESEEDDLGDYEKNWTSEYEFFVALNAIENKEERAAMLKNIAEIAELNKAIAGPQYTKEEITALIKSLEKRNEQLRIKKYKLEETIDDAKIKENMATIVLAIDDEKVIPGTFNTKQIEQAKTIVQDYKQIEQEIINLANKAKENQSVIQNADILLEIKTRSEEEWQEDMATLKALKPIKLNAKMVQKGKPETHYKNYEKLKKDTDLGGALAIKEIAEAFAEQDMEHLELENPYLQAYKAKHEQNRKAFLDLFEKKKGAYNEALEFVESWGVLLSDIAETEKQLSNLRKKAVQLKGILLESNHEQQEPIIEKLEKLKEVYGRAWTYQEMLNADKLDDFIIDEYRNPYDSAPNQGNKSAIIISYTKKENGEMDFWKYEFVMHYKEEINKANGNYGRIFIDMYKNKSFGEYIPKIVGYDEKYTSIGIIIPGKITKTKIESFDNLISNTITNYKKEDVMKALNKISEEELTEKTA